MGCIGCVPHGYPLQGSPSIPLHPPCLYRQPHIPFEWGGGWLHSCWHPSLVAVHNLQNEEIQSVDGEKQEIKQKNSLMAQMTQLLFGPFCAVVNVDVGMVIGVVVAWVDGGGVMLEVRGWGRWQWQGRW
jgi:hypothetical protein